MIFSVLRGNPGFLAAPFCAVAKFGIPREAGQILVEFVLAALRLRSGRIFLLKNPGLLREKSAVKSLRRLFFIANVKKISRTLTRWRIADDPS